MKIKIIVVLVALSLFVGCGPKITSDNAEKAVKTAFNLTEKDMVEILGISKESSDIMLVKFKIDGTDINSKMRKYDTGWQLDEVQNMTGEWIPAATAKSQFDPTEKVKLAMIEINTIATVLVNYLVDHGSFTFSAGFFFTEKSEIYKTLCPSYIESLPTRDPWGKPYNVFCGKQLDGSLYRIPKSVGDNFIIFSYGRDGKIENWTFDLNNEKAGLSEIIDPDNDIIMYDGSYIRAPKSLTKTTY